MLPSTEVFPLYQTNKQIRFGWIGRGMEVPLSFFCPVISHILHLAYFASVDMESHNVDQILLIAIKIPTMDKFWRIKILFASHHDRFTATRLKVILRMLLMRILKRDSPQKTTFFNSDFQSFLLLKDQTNYYRCVNYTARREMCFE